MKVFLTGATGYVGAAVARRLKGRDYKLSALARNDDAVARLAAEGIEPVRGELRDFETLRDAAIDADGVAHLAFSHDFDDYDEAVRLDREVVGALGDALAGTNKPLVATSSSAVLGDTRSLPADEDFPFSAASPRRLRGEAERDVMQLSSRGIRSIVVRLPLFVYGRGGSTFVPFLIENARRNSAAVFPSPGDNMFSAVHVDDVADFYFLAFDIGTAKGIYNLAAENVSLRGLSESVARLLNLKPRAVGSDEAREKYGKMFDFLSINNQLDASKANRELRWTPGSYHSIRDDIENGSYLIRERNSEKDG